MAFIFTIIYSILRNLWGESLFKSYTCCRSKLANLFAALRIIDRFYFASSESFTFFLPRSLYPKALCLGLPEKFAGYPIAHLLILGWIFQKQILRQILHSKYFWEKC